MYLDIIDNLKFNIGVQAFSNLNRVVTFHVEMKNPESRQMQLDQHQMIPFTVMMTALIIWIMIQISIFTRTLMMSRMMVR